jgi:hypothetical protein
MTRINIGKMSILPKVINKLNTILVKIPIHKPSNPLSQDFPFLGEVLIVLKQPSV